MLRIMGGLIAASLAAPYLASFFIFTFMILFGGSSGADFTFGAPSLVDDFLDFFKFLMIGNFGAAMFGLPILFAAGILAFLLHSLALGSKHHAILSGGSLGCSSLTLLFVADPADWRVFPLAGLLAGSICGWIYWRIAMRNRVSQP
ncbi:hypothetical protein [Microvirga lenta]|uniref:hypothetical protein n=1 Tax=Microvirga lenta TaxID=2881337 RepID=UPI001CFC4DCB|nr:hypothetical protein [Microvirga lenta]MCB5174590.1 hypothetical protein [Microvirga lenta]